MLGGVGAQTGAGQWAGPRLSWAGPQGAGPSGAGGGRSEVSWTNTQSSLHVRRGTGKGSLRPEFKSLLNHNVNEAGLDPKPTP